MCNDQQHQANLEVLLRQLPVSTPGDVDKTKHIIEIFLNLRGSLDEFGVPVPGTGLAFSIPEFIQHLVSQEYEEAALSLVKAVPDIATAYSFLIGAAVEAGAVSATGAVAASGTVLAGVGGAFAAAGILWAVYDIQEGVSKNHWKIIYVATVSGIVTSWLFQNPAINPYNKLTRMARTAGYYGVDISDSCRMAHRKAQEFWISEYAGNNVAIRAMKARCDDNWRAYWQELGDTLATRLRPRPTGIGSSFVRRQIRECTAAARQFEHERRRQLAQQNEQTRGPGLNPGIAGLRASNPPAHTQYYEYHGVIVPND